jgi:hypothetical protein
MRFFTWLSQFLNAPTPLQSAKAKRLLADKAHTRQLILAIRRERGQHSLSENMALPYAQEANELAVVKVGETAAHPAPAHTSA